MFYLQKVLNKTQLLIRLYNSQTFSMSLKIFETHKVEGYHSNKYGKCNDAKDNRQSHPEKIQLMLIYLKHFVKSHMHVHVPASL